jgi:hypothetical protein
LARAPEVTAVLPAEDVLDAGPDDEDLEEDVAIMNLLLVGEGDELPDVVDELGTEVELVSNGGGTTALASTSLPTPQGILSPPGCVGLAGGVEEPSAASIVKRVVQVLVAVWLEINW